MASRKKASAEGEVTRFEGFADADGKFFKRLAKNQDRAWFEAHKDEYEEGWVKPMKALLAEVRAGIDRAYEDVDLAEPKVFRIYRDVRFSADKTPYKTHIGGVILARTGKAVMEAPAAIYVQLGTERFSAAGFYMMPKEALAEYRAAVLDDARGAEIAKTVKALEKKGFEVSAGEELTRVPKGIDPEHPRARLLKLKGLIASFPEVDPKLVTSRDFAKALIDQGRAVAPLVRWLVFATMRA
jgi:uncharacterized protein (TIGR02453 family)